MTDDAGPVHLFVLSPPYSGSTVLEQLLATSPAVTALPTEGQFVDGVSKWLRDRPWDTQVERPWPEIRARWEELWDPERLVRLEKSPPNISRADDLVEHFTNPCFVLLTRDPYATAEGLERRRGSPPMDEVDDDWTRVAALEHAAQRWLEFARYQASNRTRLERVFPVTYERLVAEPAAVAEELTRWLPELLTLRADAEFESHSVRGRGSRRLQDFNAEKLDRLSNAEVDAITSVLETEEELVRALGYRLLPRRTSLIRRGLNLLRRSAGPPST